jgi:hypothetical protein
MGFKNLPGTFLGLSLETAAPVKTDAEYWFGRAGQRLSLGKMFGDGTG